MEEFKSYVLWIRCYCVNKIYANKILGLEIKKKTEEVYK